MKKTSLRDWLNRLLNQGAENQKSIDEMRDIIAKEVESRSTEMETRVTQEVLERMLEKSSESIKGELLNEEQVSKIIEDKIGLLDKSLKKRFEIIESEMKKNSLLMDKESKNNIRSSERMESRFKELEDGYKKTMERISDLNGGLLQDFTSILKVELARVDENISSKLEDKFNETERLKGELIEKESRYETLLQEERDEKNKIKGELSKYKMGLEKVKDMLENLEAVGLETVKTDIYNKYSLAEGKENLTENTIKLALESKVGITKRILRMLRDLKAESQEAITEGEIEFLASVNRYFGDEVVLLNRLRDSRVEREYWEIGGGYTKIDKIIFPPMKMGEIVPGVAQGGY